MEVLFQTSALSKAAYADLAWLKRCAALNGEQDGGKSVKLKLTIRLRSSDPYSEKYGQFWSAEDVHNMFAPHEDTVQAVKEWLTSFGIHDSRIVHSDNKGWLAFDATVEEAERLLLTEFHEHEHQHSSKVRVGCDK